MNLTERDKLRRHLVAEFDRFLDENQKPDARTRAIAVLEGRSLQPIPLPVPKPLTTVYVNKLPHVKIQALSASVGVLIRLKPTLFKKIKVWIYKQKTLFFPKQTPFTVHRVK